jgi:hypothetical protein
LFLVGAAGAASAAESSGPNFTFGASTSYAYDFNNPKNYGPDGLNYLGYANQEHTDQSFNIDLVQLGISGSRGRGSYGAKLDFGDLARYVGDDSDGDIGVQTAYLSYDMGGAAITAGRFDTPIGYEVLEPWGNANISRSYSWSLLQPINHDGVFISGHAGIFDGMFGVANSLVVHDQGSTLNDGDDEKAIIGAVGAGVNDALNLYFAMTYNRNEENGNSGFTADNQLYNLIISGKVPLNSSGFRYAIEGNYSLNDIGQPGPNGDADAWSVVAYLGADFGPTSIDWRAEYLKAYPTDSVQITPNPSNPTLLGVGDDLELWDISTTAGWYLSDGLQFRLEYRYSRSEQGDLFTEKSKANSSGNPTKDDDHLLQAQLVWYPEL